MQSDIPGMASSRTCWPALSRRFRTRGWLRAGRRYGQHYSGNILTLRWQDRKSLRNIGSKFFLTLKSLGGGSCSPSPIIHIENGIKRFLYIHIAFFCTGCPKSALRGGETKFFVFFFIGASAIKSLEKSRIFRYRLPEDFSSKGQKTFKG